MSVTRRPTHFSIPAHLDGRIPANGPGGVRSQRIRTESEVRALKETESAAGAYTANPARLRLRELETLRDLARNANARIYIGFDKHLHPDSDGKAT
jgi:hypothetical protein